MKGPKATDLPKETLASQDGPDVDIRNVSYRYPGSKGQALKDITLRVNRGELVLITGASGAGKTTLLCMLNGMVPQSYGGDFSGSAFVKGYDTTKVPVGRLAFVSGMLFQDPAGQLICPTVEDEVAFGPENRGLPVDKVNSLIDECLDYVRMSGYRDKSPHALSGGQQQAVAIASVLAMEPDIYVLDEPTSNLDPLGSQMVFDLIGRVVRDKQKTAVIVEHKLEKLLGIADRLVIMADGQIVADGQPREVLLSLSAKQDSGIYPPQVTELFWKLQEAGLLEVTEAPFTVDEAAKVLSPSVQSWRTAESGKDLEEGKVEAEDAGETVVEVEDLEFAYPDGTKAIKGVDLKVHKGEFVSIVGQNGSGKTTLVKHLNGLLRPTRGTIRIMGEDAAKYPISVLATKVGYCFQNPDHQIFSSKVFDELAFGLKNLKRSKEEIQATVEMVAERLGLLDLLDHNPHTLSKGQRQRIAVAAVLAMGPDIMIVDEPTTGQDPRQSRQMMDLMRLLNEEHGKTIIVITHDMALAAEYSHRLVVMHAGRVIFDGVPAEVFRQEEVLRSTNLEPPQITQLFLKLGIEPVAVTVDEAFMRLSGVLKEVLA